MWKYLRPSSAYLWFFRQAVSSPILKDFVNTLGRIFYWAGVGSDICCLANLRVKAPNTGPPGWCKPLSFLFSSGFEWVDYPKSRIKWVERVSTIMQNPPPPPPLSSYYGWTYVRCEKKKIHMSGVSFCVVIRHVLSLSSPALSLSYQTLLYFPPTVWEEIQLTDWQTYRHEIAMATHTHTNEYLRVFFLRHCKLLCVCSSKLFLYCLAMGEKKMQ